MARTARIWLVWGYRPGDNEGELLDLFFVRDTAEGYRDRIDRTEGELWALLRIEGRWVS